MVMLMVGDDDGEQVMIAVCGVIRGMLMVTGW